MNSAGAIASIVLLILASSATGCGAWPTWARELSGKLKCGMTLEEVSDLAAEQGFELKSPLDPWLGQKNVRKDHSALWLRFNEESHLEWVTLSKMDGWRIMATRLSPRRNLCTGELTYQVRLDWTVELEGAAVYLDGQEVQPEAGKITVSAGQHEVRIEKPGYEPIVRHLDLGPEDRGDQRIDLRNVELVPLSDASSTGALATHSRSPAAGMSCASRSEGTSRSPSSCTSRKTPRASFGSTSPVTMYARCLRASIDPALLTQGGDAYGYAPGANVFGGRRPPLVPTRHRPRRRAAHAGDPHSMP